MNQSLRHEVVDKHNAENSPTNLALQQISELQNQNHELRMQVELESQQNIALRSQLNQLSNRVNEISQSEDHFRAAFLDVKNQLLTFQQKNKDLQQALATKEMEQ